MGTKVAILLGLGLLFGCQAPETDKSNVSTDDSVIPYREHFVLGDDERSEPEAIFGQVRGVATDEAGRIYVVDASVTQARVFDRDGRYVRSIGSRGQGPGEMYEITLIVPNKDGELVLIDSRGGNVMRFSTSSGELMGSHRVEEHNTENLLNYPREGVQLANGNYLFAYRSSPIIDVPLEQEFVLHEVNEALDTRIRSFMSLASMPQAGDDYLYYASMVRPGHFVVRANGEVVVVAEFYEGELFTFRFENGAWLRHETWAGQVANEQAYTRVYGSDYPPEAASVNWDASYRALIHNQSLGIHELEDGRIVHFTYVNTDEGQLVQVEVFDEAGALVRYGMLEGVVIEGNYRGSPLDVRWKDEQDRFYLMDRRQADVVRVFSIDV